jgi:septal ring-binding cell division protein DamX
LVGVGLAAGLLAGIALHFYNDLRVIGLPGITSRAEGTAPGPVGVPEPPQAGGGSLPKPAPDGPPAAQAVVAPPAETAPPAQLPLPAAAQTVATAAPLVTEPPDTPPAPSAARQPEPPAGPVPPSSGKLAQERFAYTQRWLKTAPPGSFTIQVLTTSDSRTIERFLDAATREVDLGDLYVYSVKLNGQQYYGVTYGNYPSVEDTITAMGDLPMSFKSRGPFHRSIPVMRRQNQE